MQKKGFWHVCLDENSSRLTSLDNPFGHYRLLRMPFRFSTAPEEFQRRQDEALQGLSGVMRSG